VRARAVFKHRTVFILTSSARSEDVKRAVELRATSFLVKPANLEALATMMPEQFAQGARPQFQSGCAGLFQKGQGHAPSLEDYEAKIVPLPLEVN
jgi:DNA-binding NarL/FixJ family response regulator